jgi:hypothetical protein
MGVSKIPEGPAMRLFRLNAEAEGEARGKAEGGAKGKAEAILAVLAARGLVVSVAVAKTTRSTTNSRQLDGWLKRAVQINETRELFASGSGRARTKKPNRH